MKLRRRVVAITLSAAMFVGLEARQASAQNTTPDLKMLMNLDLFESRPGNMKDTATPGAAVPGDSMLDQIRTLDAMGYLGKQPAAGGDEAPGATAGASVPSSNPSFDAEGPQQ